MAPGIHQQGQARQIGQRDRAGHSLDAKLAAVRRSIGVLAARCRITPLRSRPNSIVCSIGRLSREETG
jgi:hypothetical protein